MKDGIQIQIDDTRYSLDGGDFSEMVEKVKAITGRRFRAVPNDKHWVLPVTFAEAEVALHPFTLTPVGKALKVALIEPMAMPTTPENAMNVVLENQPILDALAQDLRDIRFLLERAPNMLGVDEKKLLMRTARAISAWKG